MTPTERRDRVRALKAEARAWRRAAEVYECVGGLIYGDMSMVARRLLHDMAGAPGRQRAADVTPPEYDPVLACLLLALECEDEAKEVRR